ncbi:zinc finger and BTB domain-containing protein 9-like isoform X2 [Penaeus chinensis]|uniref:zinc finger and BTB domain-containing protein 9-like isoform X2 n=1 Tax=Penaeus chinensis TaxID=139456 RepID=UPI001FB6B69E|nr:zinc finger and BTB domain-containing protein 9-like isoform X2 [Penaeus chinensis]
MENSKFRAKAKRAERRARIQTYRPEWEDEADLKDWIECSEKGVEYVWCRVCECHLKAKHSDLTHHAQTVKHRRAFENCGQYEAKRSGKRPRESYVEDELEKAVKDVINKKMGYDKAAKLYKVEKEAIRYMVRGRRSEKANTEDSDEVECSQDNDSPMTLVPEPILGEPDPGAAPLQQKPEHYHLQHNNHLMTVLSALAQDEVFVDVTLTAQGHSVKAHKSVLSAMSPYFKGVLQDNPCQHPIIIMPHDVKFEELVNIINYIYKGEVTVGAGEVKSLLKAAEVLQVTGLVPSEDITMHPSNEDLAIANTINDFLTSTNSFCAPATDVTQVSTTPAAVSKSQSAGTPITPEASTFPTFIVQGKVIKKPGPVQASLPLEESMKTPFEFVNVDMEYMKQSTPTLEGRSIQGFAAPQPQHTAHIAPPQPHQKNGESYSPMVGDGVKEEPAAAVSFPQPHNTAPTQLTS